MRWNIRPSDVIASTSTLAKELWLAGDAAHGDAFTARHQTDGRGRMPGRQWHDVPGESLLMTVLLTRVPQRFVQSAIAQGAQSFQLVAAEATIAALHVVATDVVKPERFSIKAPNDILLDGKKICGILTEAVWQGDELRALIIGIGINVRQTLFPTELEAIATSLMRAGVDCSVDLVRGAVLDSLARHFELDSV